MACRSYCNCNYPISLSSIKLEVNGIVPGSYDAKKMQGKPMKTTCVRLDQGLLSCFETNPAMVVAATAK